MSKKSTQNFLMTWQTHEERHGYGEDSVIIELIYLKRQKELYECDIDVLESDGQAF